ncbi:hypothetical protein Holit_01534 [Hollandina sp. SP2]
MIRANGAAPRTAGEGIAQGDKAGYHQRIKALTTTVEGSLHEGNFRKAVEAYTAMLTMYPQYVPAYNGLGLICGALQKYAQGGILFRRGLALDPDNAMLHYNYGRILAAQGRFEPARSEYQEALRCKPDWYKPANQLGMLLCKQGQYAHALELLSANLKFNPRNAEIRDTIKQILAEQEAMRQTLKKREKEPEVPVNETMWDMEVTLSDMADMLKYLARLAEYLPAAEREHFMKSDTPSAIYHIVGLISKSSRDFPDKPIENFRQDEGPPLGSYPFKA